jgi:acyl carrier protein
MTTAVAYSEEQLQTIIFDILGEIAPEAEFDDLEADEDIREALDIDSFDFLNFLIGLNEQVGVEIPEADYGQLNTMEELIGYLQARL